MPSHTPAERRKRPRIAATALSSKTAKVKRDDPSLTNRQAVGKAAGIERGKLKKKRAAARSLSK